MGEKILFACIFFGSEETNRKIMLQIWGVQ